MIHVSQILPFTSKEIRVPNNCGIFFKEISPYIKVQVNGIDTAFSDKTGFINVGKECEIILINNHLNPQPYQCIIGNDHAIRLYMEDFEQSNMNKYNLEFEYKKEGFTVTGKALIDGRKMSDALKKFEDEFQGVKILSINIWSDAS